MQQPTQGNDEKGSELSTSDTHQPQESNDTVTCKYDSLV